MKKQLFNDLAPNAIRQPRTERLFLRRYLKAEANNKQLDQTELNRAQKILIRWADMEQSGKLDRIKETQIEGDFVREVFGDALGYTRQSESEQSWHLAVKQSYAQDIPDVSLGHFGMKAEVPPTAVVELKGPKVNLDRDRSNGRTAILQCWDYLGSLPKTQWGIVSNIVSFRLYERNHTRRRYEHYALQDLRDPETFRTFYVTFSRRSLLDQVGTHKSILEQLIEKTDTRQRTVGDELYDNYRLERHRLIDHLHRERKQSLEDSIEQAQKLMDRILFIAFCEDRQLLPERSIENAYTKTPPFTKATNPRWRNFVDLFGAVDSGSGDGSITGYNGGLFAPSKIDELDLEDEWTNFFHTIGGYDFADEVNLDVLGHLFEKSITELEKLKQGDLFGEAATPSRYAEMPKSAKQKRLGIYYTPPAFTGKINEMAVDDLLAERFANAAIELGLEPKTADTPEFWLACLGIIRRFRVVDPACGSGAFLFQAYEVLESRYFEILGHLDRLGTACDLPMEDVPDHILANNLYGVDLSPEAVEITQLALWIRTARPGRKLTDLDHNIHWGNSLVTDPAADKRAFDWETLFPEVFGKGAPGGFDAVIGNPPWERVKLQEREFFALSAPEIATASNAAKRRALIAKLESKNPELFERYQQAQSKADRVSDHARSSGRYPLTGKGDLNTYALFAELSMKLVSPEGRVGMLVPSGISTDKTNMDFFAELTDTHRLRCIYDFENKKPCFPDVHRSFKFSILCFGGSAYTTDEADFVFFARDVDELNDPKRHIALSAKDIELVNPNTKTCPIFRTRRDAELTRAIYKRVPVLIRRDRKPIANEWKLKFYTMFHQTNDAELFAEPADLKAKKYTLDGNRFVKGKKTYLPVYEAKMVQAYDHRAAGVLVDASNWMRQGQTADTSEADHSDLRFEVFPRYWVSTSEVANGFDTGTSLPPAVMGFKDITSATNRRTMIASFVPAVGFTNHFVLIHSDQSWRIQCCLLANLNSFAYDFVARQKLGAVTLNYFIVEQLPTLPPHRYAERCPWDPKRTLEEWISERVLKLSCTAVDMLPLAETCDFTGGDAEGGRLNHWKSQERADLLAELDAAYLHLYGLDRDEAEYLLSTFKIAGKSDPGLPGTRSVGESILDVFDHLAMKSV